MTQPADIRRPKRKEPPAAQVVGCYVLHLYCGECYAHAELTGKDRRGALREATDAGWSVRFWKDWARCPNCK